MSLIKKVFLANFALMAVFTVIGMIQEDEFFYWGFGVLAVVIALSIALVKSR